MGIRATDVEQIKSRPGRLSTEILAIAPVEEAAMDSGSQVKRPPRADNRCGGVMRNAVKKILRGLGVGLRAAAARLIWSAGWLDEFEWKTWDWRRIATASRSGHRPHPPGLLDRPSLDAGQRGLSWPWRARCMRRSLTSAAARPRAPRCSCSPSRPVSRGG